MLKSYEFPSCILRFGERYVCPRQWCDLHSSVFLRFYFWTIISYWSHFTVYKRYEFHILKGNMGRWEPKPITEKMSVKVNPSFSSILSLGVLDGIVLGTTATGNITIYLCSANFSQHFFHYSCSARAYEIHCRNILLQATTHPLYVKTRRIKNAVDNIEHCAERRFTFQRRPLTLSTQLKT